MIYWLASYPKSGSTWLRLFLANWWSETPIGINDLRNSRCGTQDTALIDSRVPIALQPQVRRAALRSAEGYIKTHCGNFRVEGVQLIPKGKAVCIVRDPRDVAPSFAAHMGMPQEDAVAAMKDPHRAVLHNGVASFISTWSAHTHSWWAYPRIRYEDMLNDPVSTFAEILKAFSLPIDSRMKRGIANSDITRLMRQEHNEGFREAPRGQFFGRHHDPLSEGLRVQIEADHGDVMKQMGYL